MSSTNLTRMRTLLSQGRFAEAELQARDILATSNNAYEAHALLGQFAARRGETALALYHLDRGTPPGEAPHPDLLAARGAALARAGQYELAAMQLTASIDGSSDPLGVLLRLGWVFERLDRFDDLRAILERADKLAAQLGQDISVRTAILKMRTEEWETALDILDRASSISGSDRLARGRLRDRAGRYDDAWGDFVAGKAEIAASEKLSYPAVRLTAHHDRVIDIFSADFINALPRAPKNDRLPQPIFVTGPPRSGTTLFEQLISADQMVSARGELPFAFHLVQHISTQFGSYPDGLASLGNVTKDRLAVALRDLYSGLASADADTAQAPHFVDKMPFNEQFWPLLTMAFPESPFIVMTRHPLDVVVSMMSHHLTHGYNCALNPLDAAHHLAAIDRLTAHWEAAGCLLYRQSYEQLVADPVTAGERLSVATGLSFPAANSVEVTSTPATPATPSYARARGPVSKDAVFRWRNYGHHLSAAMPIIAPLVARHGYDLD